MDERHASSHQILQNILKWGVSPRRLVFERDCIIHEPMDPANLFFIIESGEVRLYHMVDLHPNHDAQDTPRLLGILGPNEWFGSAALAGMEHCGKRAVAATRTVLLAIPAADLRKQVCGHGELAMQIITDLARQLHESWTEGSELLFENCRLRLIKTLLRFSTGPAAQPMADGVALRITHAELAQAVGAARETISLCLTGLRNQNIIQTGRNRLIFSPERLRQAEYDDDFPIAQSA